MSDLADLTQKLLAAAKSAGADSADALATGGTSVSISVLDGKLEHADRAEGIEIGLMNMKLLEKIEELTLYTLKQESELQELRAFKAQQSKLSEKVAKLEKLLNQLSASKN